MNLDYAHTGLLVVDTQNDFMPWGELPVPQGDRIVPVIQRLFDLPFQIKIACRDWHPRSHCSFASRWNKTIGEVVEFNGVQQKLWPDHCIQNSWGADLAPGVAELPFDQQFQKGSDPDIDSYSAFFNAKESAVTGIEDYLKAHDITTLVLAGLTLEYCVYTSAIHALELGHKVYLIEDGVAAIDPTSELAQTRKDEIIALGGVFIPSEEICICLNHV